MNLIAEVVIDMDNAIKVLAEKLERQGVTPEMINTAIEGGIKTLKTRKMDESIDWERFRAETAAEILVSRIRCKGEELYVFRTREELAASSVKQADALIKELKKQES